MVFLFGSNSLLLCCYALACEANIGGCLDPPVLLACVANVGVCLYPPVSCCVSRL